MSESNNVIANPEDTNPRDGWRVKEFEASMDDSISLWLEFVQDGVPREEHSFCLRRWLQDTSINSGQRERLRAVVTAIARYANLGGPLSALDDVVRRMEDTGLVIDWAGWSVLDTHQEPDDVIHYLVNGAGEVLVWAEDSYFELTTLDELNQDLLHESEDVPNREDPPPEGPDPIGPGGGVLPGPRD